MSVHCPFEWSISSTCHSGLGYEYICNMMENCDESSWCLSIEPLPTAWNGYRGQCFCCDPVCLLAVAFSLLKTVENISLGVCAHHAWICDRMGRKRNKKGGIEWAGRREINREGWSEQASRRERERECWPLDTVSAVNNSRPSQIKDGSVIQTGAQCRGTFVQYIQCITVNK